MGDELVVRAIEPGTSPIDATTGHPTVVITRDGVIVGGLDGLDEPGLEADLAVGGHADYDARPTPSTARRSAWASTRAPATATRSPAGEYEVWAVMTFFGDGLTPTRSWSPPRHLRRRRPRTVHDRLSREWSDHAGRRRSGGRQQLPKSIAAVARAWLVDDAVVLHDSNRLAVRLLPCDVAGPGRAGGPSAPPSSKSTVARRLAATGCPVAALDRARSTRVYVRDGFAVTLWTYYGPAHRDDVAPAEYAHALARLHAGMRQIDLPTPHFTDRVAEALATG